ncbi:MAG: hypothetical protein Q7S89_02595 [bacterium]|nr:hypothetical protein [bacterium]
MKSKIASIVIVLASSLLLYKNWTAWHSVVIGLIGLILYYGVGSHVWGRVVARMIPVRRRCTHLFGLLVSFYLSIMAIGIPIVLWKYDRLTTALVLVAVGIIGVFLNLYIRSEPKPLEVTPEPASTIPFTRWHLVGFIVAGITFVDLLVRARTGNFILSPWPVLTPLVPILFFVLVYLAGRAVLSNRSFGFVLVLIIALSYLTHLTLPIVYKTGYGGDRWRHLGAEAWLQEGKIYEPTALPEALIIGNKTSYAPQWGATIFLAESLNISLDTIDRFLVYILWSLFLPLLMYHAAVFLFKNERTGLIAALLPVLFGTLQTEGALTLPVSLGMIWFLFVMLVWLSYVFDRKKITLAAALAFTLFSYWGYLLYFFVLLIVGTLALVMRRGRMTVLAVSVLLAFALPALEIAHGSSESLITSSGHGTVTAFYRALEHLAGLAQVGALPEGAGNILFHQLDKSLSNLPLLTNTWLAPLLSLIVAGTLAWSMMSKKETRSHTLAATVFLVLLGSYLISWSGTSGMHILARRLNETLAVLIAVLIVPAIYRFASTRVRTIATCALVGLIATATYASGPISQVVTSDELNAARTVWAELKKTEGPYCVIGNTWPLLALEAVSEKNIVAGGFPVEWNYEQPGRVLLFKTISEDPTQRLVEFEMTLLGVSSCVYMNEERWLAAGALEKTKTLWGEPERIGTVYLWRTISKSRTSSTATRSQR